MTKLEAIDCLLNPGVIAIVRATAETNFPTLCDALIQGGVRAVEMTLTTPGAMDALRSVPASIRAELAVGVGTVLNVEQAREAIGAGARFVVSPVLRPEVVGYCREKGVVSICGAYTPTECQLAHELGADYVKLFPADGLRPTFIKSVLAPLPHLKIIPTGGITAENAASFLKAGCVAVAAGTSLVSNDLLEKGDWAALTLRARAFIGAMPERKLP